MASRHYFHKKFWRIVSKRFYDNYKGSKGVFCYGNKRIYFVEENYTGGLKK